MLNGRAPESSKYMRKRFTGSPHQEAAPRGQERLVIEEIWSSQTNTTLLTTHLEYRPTIVTHYECFAQANNSHWMVIVKRMFQDHNCLDFTKIFLKEFLEKSAYRGDGRTSDLG